MGVLGVSNSIWSSPFASHTAYEHGPYERTAMRVHTKLDFAKVSLTHPIYFRVFGRLLFTLVWPSPFVLLVGYRLEEARSSRMPFPTRAMALPMASASFAVAEPLPAPPPCAEEPASLRVTTYAPSAYFITLFPLVRVCGWGGGWGGGELRQRGQGVSGVGGVGVQHRTRSGLRKHRTFSGLVHCVSFVSMLW